MNQVCFKDGKLTDDECPKVDSYTCKCGGQLEGQYGFSPYGLGSFEQCLKCSNIYNFHEDAG